MDAVATRPDARLFAGAFAGAVAAALAAALLLPQPAPPAAPRFGEAGRMAASPASRALDRALAGRNDDPAELRRLVEELRAAHRPIELAALLERLHDVTGEVEPLREAMRLRTELGDFAAARAALARLSRIGATTAAEEIAIAEARQEAGDEGAAIAGLVNALSRLPEPALALRAVAALARLPDPAPPLRLLSARLAETAPELLEPLRRLLMEEARPDLALALIEGLPAAELASPATIVRQAEAEARAGFPGSALTRLLALRSTEGLPPGAGGLLADLALREGRLEEAFSVAAGLPAESWPPDLAMRLHQAARVAGRPELFRTLDPARLAARPEVAALVALARGDRAAAGRFARAALERPPMATEGARTLVAVLRELGQDGAAWERLRAELARAQPGPGAIRLFAELSALPGRAGTALPLLERLRGTGPAAGEAWLRLALQEGRTEEAASFLREGGLVPAGALAETLSLAAAARDAALASAAANALRGRRDLPPGWTTEEVAVTAALARPLDPSSLTAALDVLAGTAETEARRRVTALLAAAPEIGAAASGLDLGRHPAIQRLRREAEEAEGDAAIARIALIAVLSPREAVPLLARRAAAEPGRFGGALALARLRADGPAAGEAELRRLLPRLPRAQQEAALFLALAAGPGEAQPALRRLAEEALGPEWRRGYEAALTRAGRWAELVAALRARGAAAEPGSAERRDIAERLRDLGDREGAEALLR
jgi:hypothetical protein